MAHHIDVPLARGVLRVVHTDQADGDFRVDRSLGDLDEVRRGVVDLPWTWLRQVHGDEVVVVTEPGGGAGQKADAAATILPECALAVTTADCAPVVLVADHGFAVVHAGWRGLVAGVIDRAAEVLAETAGAPRSSIIGPCINPGAYEFGTADLDEAVEALGPLVRATSAWGTPALDVPRAVALACVRAGWPEPTRPPPCTSNRRFFSHRTRGDTGRQTTVAWIRSGSDPERGG